MDSQNKKRNTLILLVSCLVIVIVVGMYEYNNQEVKTNYYGLALLNLAPNSESRVPTSNDIDTGVIFEYEDGRILNLYESRTWETGDYGKTFLGGNN